MAVSWKPKCVLWPVCAIRIKDPCWWMYSVYACGGRMPKSEVLKKLVENATVEVGLWGRVRTKLTETKQTKRKQNGNKNEATIHTHTHTQIRQNAIICCMFQCFILSKDSGQLHWREYTIRLFKEHDDEDIGMAAAGFIFLAQIYIYSHSFIHSFSNLSGDRSNASSKTVPPHSAI